jgi:hypothetical protein
MHALELSSNNQQTLGSETGETWRDMAVNFAYEAPFHTYMVF